MWYSSRSKGSKMRYFLRGGNSSWGIYDEFSCEITPKKLIWAFPRPCEKNIRPESGNHMGNFAHQTGLFEFLVFPDFSARPSKLAPPFGLHERSPKWEPPSDPTSQVGLLNSRMINYVSRSPTTRGWSIHYKFVSIIPNERTYRRTATRTQRLRSESLMQIYVNSCDWWITRALSVTTP